MLRTASPLASICRVLGLPRGTLYDRVQPQNDQEVRQAIEAVAQQFPTYGSRRMAAQVRRTPYRLLVNRKRTRRILRSRGLLRRTQPRTQRTTNSQHRFRRFPNLVADRPASEPDEIWVSEITYVRLGAAFIDLAIVMDVLTRDIRGGQLGRTLGQEVALPALQRALVHHTPVMHHSDQGLQYAAPRYIQTLQAAGIQIRMAAVGEPRQHGDAERVIRTITEEEIDLAEYRDVPEALAQIGQFIDDVYRTQRIHSALGSLPPVECEAAWRRDHDTGGSPLSLL
jgi:putative transposase